MKRLIFIALLLLFIAIPIAANMDLRLRLSTEPLTAGAPAVGDVLLLETGDALLLESGDKLLLE